MTDAPGPGEEDRLLAASSWVAVGMMAMNVMTYAFTLLSAHVLAPGAFGGVSALLGVLIIAGVGALALQATAARRTATAAPAERDDVAHDVVVSAWTAAAALVALFALLTPVLVALLDVPVLAALLAALGVGPLTMVGGYSGVLQGSRRWTWLALTYVGSGVGRIVCGGVALAVDPSVTAAMLGVSLGTLLPLLVGYLGCRDVRHRHASRHLPVLREVWRNGHTLLAFFALTNVDVLLARWLFSAHDSGLYAAGAVLAKACLFLPQFVIIVAFPGIAASQARSADDRDWLRPLALITALGAAVVAGTAVLPGLAVAFVGGADYAELRPFIWLFALEGTAFAALQMVVYRQIARQARPVAGVLWTALALLVVVVAAWPGPDQRVLVLAVVATVAAVALPVVRARPAAGADLSGTRLDRSGRPR